MIDFVKHNEEVRQVWDTYKSGNPLRVPMILGISSRFYLLDRDYNRQALSYKEYFENPRTLIETQCRISDFLRHNVPWDTPMGLPEDGWSIMADFQNVFDAAWCGAEIIYPQNQCPDTRPLFKDDKYALLEAFPKGAFDGVMARVKEVHQCFEQMQAEGFEYKGRPLKEIIATPGTASDGVFTLLCQLRGSENACIDMLCDEDYFHQAMTLLTQSTINRITQWRKYLGVPLRTDGFALADDFVQLLCVEDYRKNVLGYHKKIYDAFSFGSNNFMHLCGDATRHFPLIARELGVNRFDTGFPVDFDRLRDQLGKDTEIMGGPHVELLLNGTREQVISRTKQILSGRIKNGRLILREGNNLAPKTPIQNIEAMYETCKIYGSYNVK
jgi:hypothetical protein